MHLISQAEASQNQIRPPACSYPLISYIAPFRSHSPEVIAFSEALNDGKVGQTCLDMDFSQGTSEKGEHTMCQASCAIIASREL